MGPWAQRRGGQGRDSERQMRQLREVARLGAVLRSEVGVEHVATELVTAVTGAFGFRVAALNLVRPGSEYMQVLAVSGLSDVDRQRLMKEPPSVDRMLSVMHDQFLVSHSYFISHHYRYLLEGAGGVTVFTPLSLEQQRAADAWHPEDVLLVPFFGRHQQGLLGMLSLDVPEDGKIPTQETLEPIELLTDLAAAAFDAALLFEAHERERDTLVQSLADLRAQLEQARDGRLDARIRTTDQRVTELVEILNELLAGLRDVLAVVRESGVLMGQTAEDMHSAAIHLASGAQQQGDRILDVSRTVQGMSQSVQRIAQTATQSGVVVREAIGISETGREAAERAAAGMTAVREMVLQSAKRIKRLGESMQEIGAIVEMVQDFANQTNLLALNATIEAARAGTHGRGFSVVANEIRSLANSSAEAVKQIHARIKGIQSDTAQVVVTIEHSTEQVVVQSELAARAGAALQDVDAVTQRIAASIQAMNETATQQAHTTTRVSTVMTELANITAQTWDSVERMRTSIERLGELTATILRGLEGYQLSSVAPSYTTSPPRSQIAESATQPLPVVKPGETSHPLAAVLAADAAAAPLDASSEPAGSGDEQPIAVVAVGTPDTEAAAAAAEDAQEDAQEDAPAAAGELVDVSARLKAPPMPEPEGE
jgi:methyl-accepting chemotaxis protein